ncbi:hypothetical protein SteCoe_19349 [Stentor coeruleus]|uniref:Uncharacterized protein n=1 Tax=Stentor coeruleus TaxID=5963 RepID=A0A1R2BUG5_9CILI|nr:hypothetical protein SteCoe_19349 [Stentor coeruleus]
MSIDYVFGNNKRLVEFLQSKNFDINTLSFFCKEIFVMCDSLSLDTNTIGDLIKNLKIVYSQSSENSMETNEYDDLPAKVTVTNPLNQKVFNFTLLLGNKRVPLFQCDYCLNSIKQCEIKNHALDHESL